MTSNSVTSQASISVASSDKSSSSDTNSRRGIGSLSHASTVKSDFSSGSVKFASNGTDNSYGTCVFGTMVQAHGPSEGGGFENVHFDSVDSSGSAKRTKYTRPAIPSFGNLGPLGDYEYDPNQDTPAPPSPVSSNGDRPSRTSSPVPRSTTTSPTPRYRASHSLPRSPRSPPAAVPKSPVGVNTLGRNNSDWRSREILNYCRAKRGLGWAYKTGSNRSSWRKRRFEVKNGILKYYKRGGIRSGEVLKGSICLDGCSMRTIMGKVSGRSHCFDLFDRTINRVYLIAAASEKDLTMWKTVLSNHKQFCSLFPERVERPKAKKDEMTKGGTLTASLRARLSDPQAGAAAVASNFSFASSDEDDDDDDLSRHRRFSSFGGVASDTDSVGSDAFPPFSPALGSSASESSSPRKASTVERRKKAMQKRKNSMHSVLSDTGVHMKTPITAGAAAAAAGASGNQPKSAARAHRLFLRHNSKLPSGMRTP